MGRLLRTGERVGAYEILRLLASGGEGASYLARRAARGEVVLKQYALSASEPSWRRTSVVNGTKLRRTPYSSRSVSRK